MRRMMLEALALLLGMTAFWAAAWGLAAVIS